MRSQQAELARVLIRFPARARGEYEVKRLCLASAFPLGVLRATKRINCHQRFLVYPKPEGDPRLPRDRARSAYNRPRTELGEGDDFAGVRAYELGQSQRQIDWKAVARGHPLMTKRGPPRKRRGRSLDFAAVPGEDTETRLAQLALWIIEAERARRSYGLRLRGTEIRPSLGQVHFHRCLPRPGAVRNDHETRHSHSAAAVALARGGAVVFVLPPMFDGFAMCRECPECCCYRQSRPSFGWSHRLPAAFSPAEAGARWRRRGGHVIFISYGAIKGIEPGVWLIIVLMSLEIFEAHTVREST